MCTVRHSIKTWQIDEIRNKIADVLYLLVINHQLADTARRQGLQRSCKILKVFLSWNSADVQTASFTEHVINYRCCSRHSRFTHFDVVNVKNNAV